MGSNPTLSAEVKGTAQLMGEQMSDYEWKRKRGWINRTAERIEDMPANLLSRKGALTNSRKRELYEDGAVGKATILKAPSKFAMSAERGGVGRYALRVELPGREPYEVKTWQDVTGADWKLLTPGTTVEVRVHPDDHERVLLCPPETPIPGRATLRPGGFVDSSQIIAEGMRAVALVKRNEKMEGVAPGTEDPVYVLELELRSEREAEAWQVRIGQRVPTGAEALIEPGRELQAAYLEVDEGDSVAIDWPASSQGRFS